MSRSSACRVLAVLLVGLIAGAVARPSPVLAHGTLAASTPANGGTVTERVDAVSLTFTEKPAPFAYFTITAPTGVRVDAGWSNAEPVRLAKPVREYQLKDGKWEPLLYETGFPISLRVSHLPAAGQYVVTYHNVASDGDAVKGEIRFTYRGEAAPAPPGWQAPTDQPKPELLAAAARPPEASAQPSPSPVQATAPVLVLEKESGPWTWLVPVLLVVAAGLGYLLIAPQLKRRSSRK